MKLAFREYGSGQPILILHGLFGQSDNWNTLAKQFAGKSFRVFALDQRNHGLSPHSDTWTYEAMAADLNGFIEEHGLQKPILIGHSMGAKTVMFHEKFYPGNAGKLVIADMAARRYENHHEDVLRALHAVDFSRIRNRKEAEKILNEHLKDFGTIQFLLKNIYWKDEDEGILDWRFNLGVISSQYDHVRAEVPFFNCDTPTLVVRGERSNYVTESDLADFRKRFSDLKVATVAGAGHWVHAEKPAEFFSAVMDFIRA